jgi:hypothetical protein
VTGGSWAHADSEGTYRLIAYGCGGEHIYHHLFIQLLKRDSATQNLIVAETVPVVETQDMNAAFRDIALVAPKVHSPAVFEGRVVEGTVSGDREDRFKLQVEQDGKYKMSLPGKSR